MIKGIMFRDTYLKQALDKNIGISFGRESLGF